MSRLSEADQALQDQLDWARIQAATEHDYDRLDRLPIRPAISPGIQATGCTCPTIQNPLTQRYEVKRHVCDFCVGWDRMIRSAGIRNQPKPNPVRSNRKRTA